MGLLDDAIRQHLDLKRRHGADPTDVAKLEHEAFGPIVRGEARATPGLDAPASAAGVFDASAREEPFADVEADDEEWASTHPAAEPAATLPPPRSVAPEPAVPQRPRAAPEPVAPIVPEPPRAAPEPLRPGGSVPLDDIGERTVEFSALHPEPDPQPDAEPGEHDELEETPDFLQETPEHDRLWFEQKPPRDFDF